MAEIHILVVLCSIRVQPIHIIIIFTEHISYEI